MPRVSLCTIASEIYKTGIDSRVHGLGLLRVKVIEFQRLQAIGQTVAKTGIGGSRVAQVLCTYLHVVHPVRTFGLQALIRLLFGSIGIGGIRGITGYCDNETLLVHGS